MTTTATEIPVVNFAQAVRAIKVAAAANQAILLLGDPGVGKSALVQSLAAFMSRILATLLGATLDPTDVGGLPVIRVDGKGIDRVPLQVIRQVAEAPGILFLDEISAAPLPVQAAMLRLVLERVAGDVTLHPETRVIAACNPPEQAPGGFDLSAPLMGRLCVLRFRPEDQEITDHLATLGSDDEKASDMDRAVREEAVFLSTIMAKVAPTLLQIDIPPECVQGNIPWGAPRAWERVIRARAAAKVLDVEDRATVMAMTAGSVGSKNAVALAGIMDMIKDLPTVDEIVADPHGAKIPTDPRKQVSALAIMSRLAGVNGWAAYIYAARLRTEFGQACHKILLTLAHKMPPLTDRWAKAGVQARVALTAGVKRFA